MQGICDEHNLFLLTPLREGRPKYGAAIPAVPTISTHAPAGGATREHADGCQNISISTHAPAGGATKQAAHRNRCGFHFYSRPCGRGDKATSQDEHLGEIISTHAPAGGATR